MSGYPFWRRLDPQGGAARALALGAVLCLGVLLWALVWAPLQARIAEAKERADSLHRRAAALEGAAAARRAEAAISAPDGARLGKAEAWLAVYAPIRADGEAMLELLSTLRLVAETTGVELVSVSPLDAGRDAAARDMAAAADIAGLAVHVAEARIVADHAGLARFLGALEAVRPVIRAPALEISARSGGAADEARRLSATVIVAALSRPGAE